MPQADPRTDEVPCYLMPEETQLRLQQIRDHLQFLAALSQPRAVNEDTRALPPVSMAAVSHCFSSLATQLDEVLKACWWAGFSPPRPPPPA